MIIRTNQIDIDGYFENDSLSSGKIKRILKGMDAYNKEKDEKLLYYEEKGHFLIGNGVDIWLTQGEIEYNKQFHIATVDKPTGKTLSILMYLYDQLIKVVDNKTIVNATTFLQITDEDILIACDTEEFQKGWGDVAKIKAVRKASDYFDELCISHGKQILGVEEHEIISNIVKSLKDSEVTKHYFPEETPQGIDIYYQYPIYFNHMGIACKALLDIIYVNHNNKTIELVDLKTFGNYTIEFPYQAVRLRYDIQAAFYDFAFNCHDMNSMNDYEIKPFTFVVESTKVQGNPIIYISDDEFLNMGTNGRPEGTSELYVTSDIKVEIAHKPVFGFREAMERYKWHLENGFEKDRVVAVNNNILILGWNRIIV